MSSKNQDTAIEPPVLPAAWFVKARPAKDVLPANVMAAARRAPGRPKAAVTKEAVNIRLSADVLSTFRAGGAGWQTRIDAALREWIAHHQGAAA
ncbi:MAG: BrnA antitoxin family protein [Burkholderiaceae bacterium]|jgi:uncharacterized protein (DUF4415 family)|nr:BrnA antitoxin family protein [Burkholderiaceae bacterium]